MTFAEANRIQQENPTTFKRQVVDVNGMTLVLFDYYYADWRLFRDEPMSREMRGIIFDADTGAVVSRPFHKFFNINENDETQEDKLLLQGSYTEKFDGSLAQVTYYNGQLIVASRSSLTGYVNDAVSKFIKNNRVLDGVMEVIKVHQNLTFLFEFLDPDNRIVLSYPKKELVFLNTRHKKSGVYDYTYQDILPGVRATPRRPLTPEYWEGQMKEELATRENFEGYVLNLPGYAHQLVKVKTQWYFQSHGLVTEQNPTKYVNAWASNDLDDLVASLRQLGHGDIIDEIEDVVNKVETYVGNRVVLLMNEAANKETPKELAIALNKIVSNTTDRLVFSQIMSNYRNEELTVAKVFNDTRTSLHDKSSKIKEVLREAGVTDVEEN